MPGASVPMKTWTKADLQAFIEVAEERSLANMVVALWKRQTEDEQATDSTNHNNGKGFTGADAKKLSIMAKYAMKHHGNPKPYSNIVGKNGKANDWMIPILRKRLRKYAGQLALIKNQQTGQG